MEGILSPIVIRFHESKTPRGVPWGVLIFASREAREETLAALLLRRLPLLS